MKSYVYDVESKQISLRSKYFLRNVRYMGARLKKKYGCSNLTYWTQTLQKTIWAKRQPLGTMLKATRTLIELPNQSINSKIGSKYTKARKKAWDM